MGANMISRKVIIFKNVKHLQNVKIEQKKRIFVPGRKIKLCDGHGWILDKFFNIFTEVYEEIHGMPFVKAGTSTWRSFSELLGESISIYGGLKEIRDTEIEIKSLPINKEADQYYEVVIFVINSNILRRFQHIRKMQIICIMEIKAYEQVTSCGKNRLQKRKDKVFLAKLKFEHFDYKKEDEEERLQHILSWYNINEKNIKHPLRGGLPSLGKRK